MKLNGFYSHMVQRKYVNKLLISAAYLTDRRHTKFETYITLNLNTITVYVVI